VETKQEKSDNEAQLRELAARVATEQDHDKFTQRVKELNQLLDGELLDSASPTRSHRGKTRRPRLKVRRGALVGSPPPELPNFPE
jgi:ferric-dicitrate binding protein FerR (iron transport regulator)